MFLEKQFEIGPVLGVGFIGDEGSSWYALISKFDTGSAGDWDGSSFGLV